MPPGRVFGDFLAGSKPVTNNAHHDKSEDGKAEPCKEKHESITIELPLFSRPHPLHQYRHSEADKDGDSTKEIESQGHIDQEIGGPLLHGVLRMTGSRDQSQNHQNEAAQTD